MYKKSELYSRSLSVTRTLGFYCNTYNIRYWTQKLRLIAKYIITRPVTRTLPFENSFINTSLTYPETN